MEADEEPTTDQILAAFRDRRREANAAAKTPAAGSTEEGSPAASSASPLREVAPAEDAGTVPASAAPPVPPAPATPPAPAAPAPMHRPPVEASWAPVPDGAGALAIRPAVQSTGPMALTIASPGLNLSSRLLEDRFVSRSGNRTGVAAGLVLTLLGLGILVLDQALLAQGIVVLPLNYDLSSIGVALAGLGLLVAIPFLFLPRRRSLRVRLAATQQEEWARVKAEAAELRRWTVVGALAAVLGLAGAAAAYSLVAPPNSGVIAGALALLAIGGTILLAWAASRRSLVQRLYVQTLVLSRLEQTGLGPAAEPDPRIAPVLRSLDRLLGALPESAVRRFLASDEATQYLELIDDLSKDRGHGR